MIPLDKATGFNIAMNSFSCSCSSMALSIGHNLLGVYLLQCGLIWGPQSLQGCTCCVVNLSMGTDASKVLPAVACTYPESQTLWDVPFPAWTFPWATIPSGLHLPWCGLNHDHRCFGVSCSQVDLFTDHRPFSSSSHWSSSMSSTAANEQTQCLGHHPVQVHVHHCYQNIRRHRQSKMRKSAANSKHKKH